MTLVHRLELAALGPACPRQAQRGGEHRHLLAGVLAEEQDVEHGQLREEPAVLERAHHADAEALLGQVLGQVDVVQPDGPGLRCHETRDHVERGRLARAVGADQPDDGTRLRLEGHPVERVHPAELHAAPRHGEAGRVHRRRSLVHRGHCSAPSVTSVGVTGGPGAPRAQAFLGGADAQR